MTCDFLAACIAQDLEQRGEIEAASELLTNFISCAARLDWTLSVGFWRVAAEAALRADRTDLALEHCERGLAVVADSETEEHEREGEVEVAALLLNRALVRQQRGEVASARRDIIRARRLATDDPEVRQRLLFRIADQCLLTEDRELAESTLSDLAKRARDPVADLYRAVILGTLPTERRGALEGLRHAHGDARLGPRHRQLAAGLTIQLALMLDRTTEDLRSELDLVALSCPRATTAKLVAARAEAWLKHGDPVGVRAEALQEEIAAALRASQGPAISATHLGRLWNDDLAWLINIAVRVHWRARGSDWRGALAIALENESARNQIAVSQELLEQLQREHAPARGALLVYLAGRFSSAALLLTATQTELLDGLPSVQSIRIHGEDALAYLRATARGTQTDLEEGCVTELSRALLPEELLAMLRPLEQLTIARIGRFEQIPFDALPVGTRSAGETWAISHATALLDDWRRLAHAPATGSDLHIMGSLEPAQKFAAEVGGKSRLTREHVAACLAPRGGKFDDVATPSTVFAVTAPPRVAQFIGHGTSVIRDDVRINVIALSPDSTYPDGLLTDAPPSWRAPPFVILSVCDHATTETVRGEHQLTGAFAGTCMRHGTSAVLAPLGGVQLGPHMELIARVHEELKPEVSLARALLAARRALCPAMERAARAQALLLGVHGNGHQAVFRDG